MEEKDIQEENCLEIKLVYYGICDAIQLSLTTTKEVISSLGEEEHFPHPSSNRAT